MGFQLCKRKLLIDSCHSLCLGHTQVLPAKRHIFGLFTYAGQPHLLHGILYNESVAAKQLLQAVSVKSLVHSEISLHDLVREKYCGRLVAAYLGCWKLSFKSPAEVGVKKAAAPLINATPPDPDASPLVPVVLHS